MIGINRGTQHNLESFLNINNRDDENVVYSLGSQIGSNRYARENFGVHISAWLDQD